MFLLRKLSGRSGFRQDDSNTSSHEKDDISKQALEQASEYVCEGDYEEALWILERLGKLDPAIKGIAELAAVAEVCNAAILGPCSCSRRNRNLDWYKILKVDEKSDVNVIKKQYRNLALLLHPDKNKHMKAEAAFKLVSEAYACLSDKKKRELFNMRRSFTNCKHCVSKDCTASGSGRWPDYHGLREQANLRRPGSSPDLTQMDWALDQERLKRFRARARARVLTNLERVCKERGFTGLKKTNVLKEVLDKHLRGETRRNTSFYGCKVGSNDTNHEKQGAFPENFTGRREQYLDEEDNLTDAAEQDKVSHRQLAHPRKNLGLLIRDLQAEYLSAAESEDVRKDGQIGLIQELTLERKNAKEDNGHTESLSQDSQDRLDAISKTEVDGNFMEHAPQTTKVENQATNLGHRSHSPTCNCDPFLSVPGFTCPDNPFDSPAQKNDECQQSFDEGFMVCNRMENDSKLEKPEPAIVVMECHELKDTTKKSSCRIRNQDEENPCPMLKKENLCRQACQDDSLCLEETILRTQKEKSEQVLRTLQRLRDETKTVAASLNHLYFGRS